jgi:Rrf2 family protein
MVMVSLKLTATAEYALRAMSYLALLPKGQALSAALLAENTGVPLHYLLKVMRKLVAADMVISAKGHGGGFYLARLPNRISYRHILEAVGYEKPVATCVFGWGKCRDSKPCPMHESWKQLNQVFSKWAEGTTLEDILQYSNSHTIYQK